MNFPVFTTPTLSIITEATERSESLHPSYEPIAIPETSKYSDNFGTSASHIPRASIFSSETSYGELLPPGQSMFKGLGLGVSPSQYEKSLPSLPPGSVAALSVSAQSGQKTESRRVSLAHSDISKRSIAKSESLRHSTDKPESFGAIDEQEPVDKPRLSEHISSNSVFARLSSSKSESPIPFEHVIGDPGSSQLPLLPHLPSKTSTVRSISSVSTHSKTHSGSRAISSSASTSNPHLNSVSSTPTQSTLRTFADMVDEVATSLAVRAKMRAETVSMSDRTKIGVCTTMSRGDDQSFMRVLAAKLHITMALHSSYLFALTSSAPSPVSRYSTLIFCGAPQQIVTRASILAGLRFKTRLAELQDTTGTWIGQLELGEQLDAWDVYMNHEDVLWDIVRKAANLANSTEPPPGSRGIERILADARARLDRLSPIQAFTEAMRDGILVDIRPVMQRAEHGTIPGALIIERNVLEWRFDPRCVDGRLPIADKFDLRIIVYCQEGYTSSLAAAALQDIGLWRATDIDGGFARWKSEGYPVDGLPVHALTADYLSVTPTTPLREAIIGE